MNDARFIVTGASEGIGRAVAVEIASRGRSVVAVARSKERLLELSDESVLVTAVPADVATEAGVAHITHEVSDDGPIGGVVHSAASLVPLQPYSDVDPAELVEHFRVHVAAPIALYQALAIDHPIERMLFIDSYSGATPRLGYPAYSVVKAAAQMAARTAALEIAPTRVIRVFPGAVNTQIVGAVLASDSPTKAVFAEMLEKGEFAEPADAARFIVDVLVGTTDDVLDTRDVWDYNDPGDRAEAGG